MTTPTIVTTKAELRTARAAMTGTVAFVPTMGALHDGHVANMREARSRCDHVIVSIFVNPLQFGPTEDFDAYPRDLEKDIAVCKAEGIDLVFAPTVAEMYPVTPRVAFNAGELGGKLEGASRPGFFDGVLIVVSKLFNLVRPDVACFGEKDYQQLAIVRNMATDLDLAIDVVGVATVREDDGLARSSRNVYLSESEYTAALAIPEALNAAQQSSDPLKTATDILTATDGVRVDYITVTGNDLGPAPETGSARLLVAAFVGTTRLIDNAAVNVGENHA